MDTGSLESREKIINGGPVYLVEPGEWDDIVRTGQFLGEKAEAAMHLQKAVESWSELARDYPEISTGLHRSGHERFGLMPIVLLEIGGGLQRIHIEQLTCEVCRWSGVTANPMMPDLYLCIPDQFRHMRDAEKYPVLPCPACGAKLPRHPIWIGPVKNAGGLTSPILGEVDNKLFYAVKLQVSDAFRVAIDGGANANAQDEYNETPLIYAAQGESLAMVEELLARGAEMDHKGEQGWTPLRYAIDKRRTAIARHLIANGADIHGTDQRGKTHLYWAVFRQMDEIARLLIEKGADVNAVGSGGSSCLKTAVVYPDNLEMVRLLVGSGADLTYRPQDILWSAAYTAAGSGETSVLEYLFDSGLETSPILPDGSRIVELLEKYCPHPEGTQRVAGYLRNRGF
jgi:ankyrin repeat protein